MNFKTRRASNIIGNARGKSRYSTSVNNFGRGSYFEKSKKSLKDTKKNLLDLNKLKPDLKARSIQLESCTHLITETKFSHWTHSEMIINLGKIIDESEKRISRLYKNFEKESEKLDSDTEKIGLRCKQLKMVFFKSFIFYTKVFDLSRNEYNNSHDITGKWVAHRSIISYDYDDFCDEKLFGKNISESE